MQQKIMYAFLSLMLMVRIESLQSVVRQSEKILGPKAGGREEIAKQFLQHYDSYSPVVMLVDQTGQDRMAAHEFLRNFYQISENVERIEFKLMQFNESGISGVLETTKNDRKNFYDHLDFTRNNTPKMFIGFDKSEKTAVFFAIINGLQQIPEDSAVLIFLSRVSEDDVLVQHAFIEMRKKNAKIYVIWNGKKKNLYRIKLLEDLVRKSGGKIFVDEYKDSYRNYLDFYRNADKFGNNSIILLKNNLNGEKTIGFPVDFQINGLWIRIVPSVESAVLSTANNTKIDLFDPRKIVDYSYDSFLSNDANSYDIYLDTREKTTHDVGFWRLHINGTRATYAVSIYADTNLTTESVLYTNRTTGIEENHGEKKLMKLGVNGDINLITNISLVDRKGQSVLEHIELGKEQYVDSTSDGDDVEIITDQSMVKIPIKIPENISYAVITGRDRRGYQFTRTTYVANINDNTIFQLPPLYVEVGLGSQLIVEPNQMPQIYFEITNNADRVSFVRFSCSDEQSILLSMSPWQEWIRPKETAIVRLTLITKAGSYRDTITFRAYGNDLVEKKVIVDVGYNVYMNDKTEPEIDYQYTSDCSLVVFSDCRDGTWTLQVRSKDRDSGLLQLTTNPRGLYFPDGFPAGTSDEVVGYLSESCCNPDLQITAVDRNNNRRIEYLNAYRAKLGPGAIAAIVLGVLLFILILVIIVYAIRRCCVKPRDSYDLPTYRGPARRAQT